MQKVLFIDSVHPLIEQELSIAGYICDLKDNLSQEEIESIIGNYHGIIIRSRFILDSRILSKATSLKWIGRVGAGMENIDLPFAEKNGIVCFNSPEGNRDAVGEHTLGILLSLLNHLNRADLQVRNRKWIREANRGIEIKGKTVAIIGYGNMGSAFAQRLKGFEANVISYDKYKTAYSDGNTWEEDMSEVYQNADILSLHIPLTQETHHMVNFDYLNKFKKDIFLINTSRGAVVHTGDLVKAMQNGKVRGAALDVLECENKSFEGLSNDFKDAFNFLTSSENVVLTPHIAGWTIESNIKLAEVLVYKIKNAFPSGK